MTSRKDIRTGLVDLLKTAKDTPKDYPAIAGLKMIEASSYVKVQPRKDADIYPAALIYIEGDKITTPANSPGPKDREATLAIELHGFGDKSEEQIDELAQEIETLIDRNLTLPGDIVSAAILEQVVFDGDDGGDRVAHFARLDYRVEYTSETEGWDHEWNE
ncbi:hypothetical protein TRICHSKD4_3356 [Roseibium sp. TrichSKD4]|uniref:hypothetical protein n=1 Tax=Roseibium sp. TrichSKD4 TaxID=744980 RepID=UPI0001E56F50|nr:hypothetical protein [Roseibium sp. TrichSKD4]EFO31339.1 hypothetical protein TRICHSKD4_3356 [Roseibium sp. TrichSKD4]